MSHLAEKLDDIELQESRINEDLLARALLNLLRAGDAGLLDGWMRAKAAGIAVLKLCGYDIYGGENNDNPLA